MRVITFGTFDLFHVGHLNILERCKNYKGGDNEVFVGVSSDKLNFKKKGCYPIINEYQREKIVGSIKYVDLAFREESLELKEYYCKKYNADILIMGDDHKGRFDHLKDLLDIEVLYFPRTENVSTTAIRSKITDSHI